MSIKVFGPFVTGLLGFLLSSFKSALYGLNNTPLSDVPFASIFSRLWLVLSFSDAVFHRAELSNVAESSLSVTSFTVSAFVLCLGRVATPKAT